MFHTSSNNGWKKIYLDIAGCDDLSSGHPKVKKKLVQFQQQRIWHGFKLIEEPTDNTLFATTHCSRRNFGLGLFFFFHFLVCSLLQGLSCLFFKGPLGKSSMFFFGSLLGWRNPRGFSP